MTDASPPDSDPHATPSDREIETSLEATTRTPLDDPAREERPSREAAPGGTSLRRPAPGSTAHTAMPDYKGAELDPARGPGLGCFWVQVVLLALLIVVTPLTASAGWPPIVTGILFIAMLVLLLLSGQTVIFLLRLVAAERGQRRPLASRSRTVGQIEAERDDHAGRPDGTSATEATQATEADEAAAADHADAEPRAAKPMGDEP